MNPMAVDNFNSFWDTTDIGRVLYFLVMFSITLIIFFIFYDKNPPQPPIP